MASELPPQVQNQIAQLQQLQQQASVVISQRQQLEVAVREVERALEELEKTTEDAPIYRSVGGLLVRAKDRGTVVKELQDTKETTGIRLESIKRQEQRLRERLESLQKELQAALGGR
ncbi:MAG: prefoldin subunit beta [Thermoplasmatota archaeon]